MQGRDHPVLLGVPETYYLKCFILQKTRVTPIAARRRPRARRALKRMARPAGDFDASRYFRGAGDLGFYNVGTSAMRRAGAVDSRGASRRLVRSTTRSRLPTTLIVDRHLEVKSVGIEVVARYRREFTPALLPTWKRWLAR